MSGPAAVPARRQYSCQRLALFFLQVIPIAIIIAAPYGDRQNVTVFDELSALRICGLASFVLGMALMHWAEATLDRLFSVQVTIQEGHNLVTDGPYRFLRHPRYLGIILFAIGLSLIFRSWLGLILVGALTLVLLWRIHDEEALMHETFGEEWETYARRTRRLIPFVY